MSRIAIGMMLGACVLVGCGQVKGSGADAGSEITADGGHITIDARDVADAGANEVTLHVELGGAGAGTIVSNPAGISCPGVCDANFTIGTEVTLSAAANRASGFTGWTGDCAGLDPCVLAMTAERTATASFEAGGMVLDAQSYGGTNGDFVFRSVTDPSGNLIIAGHFTGTLNLGGSTLQSTNSAAGAPSRDIFVAKYTPAGGHVWSVSYGGAGTEEPWALDVDSDGNVYVGGHYNAAMSFGNTTLTRQASDDAFLAKLAGATGAPLWAKGFSGNSVVKTWGLAVTSTRDVIMTFYFKGTANFGNGSISATAGDDIILARYSGVNGNYVWSKRFGGHGTGAADDQIHGLAIDGDDNILVSGYFMATLDLGGTPLVQSGTGRDMFIARFDSNGTHQWSRSFESTNDIFSGFAAVDGNGDFVVSATFSGTASFGGDSFTAGEGLDIIVAKYSGANGNHLWSRRWAGDGYKGVRGVAILSGGDVVVGGFYNLDMDVDGTVYHNATRTNLFAARLSATNGELVWFREFGDSAGAGGGVGRTLTVGPHDRIFLAGTFNDSVTFGPGNSYTSSGGVEDLALVTLLP